MNDDDESSPRLDTDSDSDSWLSLFPVPRSRPRTIRPVTWADFNYNSYIVSHPPNWNPNFFFFPSLPSFPVAIPLPPHPISVTPSRTLHTDRTWS